MKTDFSKPFSAESHNDEEPHSIKKIKIPKLSGNFFKLYPFLFGIILPIIFGYELAVKEEDFLWRAQELNIFMQTREFWDMMNIYPGGALAWLSSYFTQLFYYPPVGVSLLVVFWIAIFWITRFAFKVRSSGSVLLFMLPLSILATIVQLGYFIYYIKLAGYFFSPTIGMLLAVSSVAVYSIMPRKYYQHVIWMLLWTCAAYPLAGAYSLAGTFYMIVREWMFDDSSIRNRLIPSVAGIIMIVVVPLVAYQFYSQTSISYIYQAALPSFDVIGKVYPVYRLPFYIMFAVPVACAVWHMVFVKYNNTVLEFAAGVLMIVASYFINNLWYKDANFTAELKMCRALENNDWEGILSVSRSQTQEPTRMMVMLKNLAVFRLGRAGDEMFHYREGGAKPNAPFDVHLVQLCGKSLYYHYGQENYCYRWCMEDGVVYGWKAEYLKYMAKSSLVSGDYKVADKYLSLLEKTMFHKEWAKHYRTYLENPGKMKESGEFKPILSLMPAADKLSSDLSVIETYLMKTFAYDDSDDPVYQEQTLISALQMKDIQLFWPRFFKYASIHSGEKMPVHYQEAAFLYGNLEKNVDISHMPFDKEVVDTYNRFMEFSKQCGGMTEQQMAEAFYPQFGHTFYYFYFLMNGLQTY